MHSQPCLRPVEAGDQAFLLDLVASARPELARFERTVSEMLVRMQYDAQVSGYRQRFPSLEENIVLADGHPVGRLYVARSRYEIRVVDISLLPAFRRQHIGGRLLSRLQEESARAGVPLRLQVLHGNPARELYCRHGFQPREADQMYLAMEWNPTFTKE